jgi:hypothetical protein
MPTCNYCEVAFPNKIVIEGRCHNLQRRKYCLNCSPFGAHNTRQLFLDKRGVKSYQCTLCGKDTTARMQRRCQSCCTKIRRYLAKSAAVKLLGGKCNRCGWEGHLAAYEFHHLDPKQKEFSLGSVSNKKWEIILNELSKCELLCSNCHRIEHSDHSETLVREAARYKGRILGG